MQSRTRFFCHVHRGWLLALVLITYVCTSAATAAAATTIIVTTTADHVSHDGHCSLREAITAANSDAPAFLGVGECPPGSGADTVVLPAGRYVLSIAGAGEDQNATGDLDISGSTTLLGAGAAVTTIDANHIDRAIDVQAGVTATIEGVTITGGLAPSGSAGASQTGASGGSSVGRRWWRRRARRWDLERRDAVDHRQRHHAQRSRCRRSRR